MRQQQRSILFGTLVAVSVLSTAAAQTPPSGIPAATHDWGCEVLLCLANPAGPMAVSACVPPISRLYRELARGHTFPTCRLASGPKGQSYAKMAWRLYDACPSGTTGLPLGAQAVLAGAMTSMAAPPTPSGAASSYAIANHDVVYTGIGDGSGTGSTTSDGPEGDKVCVAGPAGSRMVRNDQDMYSLGVYRTMYVSPAQRSPRVIDIYIDNSLWQSVRW